MVQCHRYALIRSQLTTFVTGSFVLIISLCPIPQLLAEIEKMEFTSPYANYLPGVSQTTYSQIGDINIGDVVSVSRATWKHPAESCQTITMKLSYVSEVTESVAFAVDMVNNDPRLLPNVSLGFIQRGACSSPSVTLATSLSFLPRSQQQCHLTSCPNLTTITPDTGLMSHDVIGLIAPSSSSKTLPISMLCSVAHLPLVGYISALDEFSDKKRHPYFFRTNPPDIYLIRAIFRFLFLHDWSYFSMVYMDDEYGQNAYRNVKKISAQYGYCVAKSYTVNRFSDYDKVVKGLLSSRARVVIVLIRAYWFKYLLNAVVKKNATSHFVWIGGPSIDGYYGYRYNGVTQDAAIGTFIFNLEMKYVPSHYDRLNKININTTANPWLKPVWEKLLSCSYDDGSCPQQTDVTSTRFKYRVYKPLSLKIDAVLAFAHAAHDLLSERCPLSRGQEARACITGELLKKYMQKVDFEGITGRVTFDKNHDNMGKYIITQLTQEYRHNPLATKKNFYEKIIGIYDTAEDSINFSNETITWSHWDTLNRIVLLGLNSNSVSPPESVCSRPCVTGEFKIEKETTCCWECRTCRENEYLVHENTSCQACPSFTWPNPQTGYTTCQEIPLTYPNIPDTAPTILVSFSLLALISTISTFVWYAIYRNERIIKASSRELSVIQFTAMFVGFTTVIFFQTTPCNVKCNVIFFGFCISFSLLYSPLLVKTIRIYRVFRSNVNNKPCFISTRTQIGFTIFLVAIQICLCIFTSLAYSPGVRRSQLVRSEKLVELSCDFTLPGLTSFLVYNIILVSLCSVFAFKVRKLPDNFNESRFISMCAFTTLLVWLVFAPTYFMVNKEYIRVFLMSMALLINHFIALVLLFMPRVYAARFHPSQTEQFEHGGAIRLQ